MTPTKNLCLILALGALPPATAMASDFKVSPTGGLYGGRYFTPQDNPLDSSWTVVGRLGVQVAPLLDVEADLGWAQSTTRQHSLRYDLFDPRLNALVHLTPERRFDAFVGAGVGWQRVVVNRDSIAEQPGVEDDALYENPSGDFIANLGPGVTVRLVGPLHLRTDLRWLGSFGAQPTDAHSDAFQNLEWTLGLELRREGSDDADGDGIKDRDDACPDEPEDFDDFEDVEGCPDPDNDEDGILDPQDRCPLEPEDHDGFEDRDGCPDLDNDQDGILDLDDDCPDEPEDVDGYQDDDGCPDPDNDGDGVLDVNDRCDGELETDNNYQDDDGCPDEIPEAVARFTGVIQGINFQLDSAAILPSSDSILFEALAVLQEFPDVRLEVQGHTDDQGTDEYNVDLSQRRTESVVVWFVERGVDPARLVPRGYGESRPIDTNATPTGRAQNRRVEFQLIDR